MKFIKFFKRVVTPIIGLLSLFVILSFPFLANKLHYLDAIICFACSVVVFPIIILTGNSKNKKNDIVTMILFYYIFSGIFVINYFNTSFNWLWFIFGLIIIGVPFGLYFVNYWYKLKNKLTKEQKLNFKRNAVKYSLFYYALDLFYMSFIIENITCKYIFGGIIILYIFYNSTKAFINNVKPRIFFLVQDVFIGLGITIYLIFIIPNDDLRNVVTSIVSAVFGGYVTLLGVAWTIKDNSRNRKEEERIKNIPYIFTSYENSSIILSSFEPVLKSKHKKESNVIMEITINEFNVKNSNNCDCIPFGFYLNDEFYKFDTTFFIERNSIFKISIDHHYKFYREEKEVKFYLVVKDILNNCYLYECEMRCNNREDFVISENKTIPLYSYEIINIKLPVLII